MQLNDSTLLKNSGLINGQWYGCKGDSLAVANPATGDLITDVGVCTEAMVIEAVKAAHDAGPAWREKTADERAAILYQWFELTKEHIDDLAMILTSEQGKPLAESSVEIKYGASYLHWFAEEARRIKGYNVQSGEASRDISVLKQPVGVVAAITPWNFPSAMLARKMAPALAAGCTVVCKPASATPLSALAMVELAERAGVPKGVLNCVVGDASTIGNVLTKHELVRKVTFTGSTEVGKALMSNASDTVKKMSLELGGNAPFIVCDDADLEAAVDGTMAAKFRNSGQVCICANRIFVHDSLFEAFTKALVEKVKTLVCGNGTDSDTTIGPLIHKDAVKGVSELVNSAVQAGAKVHIGGEASDDGRYYMPTVLTQLTADMDIFKDEIFGPVAALYSFSDLDDVIKLANQTPFGLASYVYTESMSKARKISAELAFGMVGINTGSISSEKAPFGGIKESGFGREGGPNGIDDYLNTKYLCQSFE